MVSFISIKKYGLHIQWLVFLLSTFFLALTVSWMMLAKVNFAYPLLYDYAGIGDNIVSFAPNNKIKPDFDQSSRAEHLALFSGIVTSIHQHGEGLESLTYHAKKGIEVSLLTSAEIIHLQDVANLYDKMKWLAWGALFIWLGSVVIQRKLQMDVFTVSLLPYVFVLPLVILAVLAIGAEKIFYKLHTLVFPDGHQWVFYYEESLMSMMMMAPDLFAYIAVMLVFLAIFFTTGIFWLYRRYQ
jgi:hypothetical protein